MDKKEVTIYDIARQLGLSPSTISKGLKGHPTISQKTQRKIAATAESMGYRFNTFAANLRKNRTNTIGLIVPRLNSLFVSQVIAGIEKATNDAGYNLIISQSLEHMEKEVRNVKTMLSNRVDGLLVSLAEDTANFDHFNIFKEKSIPLLFFDRVPFGHDFPSVSINNEVAGYQVARHLIEQGAKKLVHITGNQLRNVYADRCAGFQRAIEEAGLPFTEEQLIISELSEAAGIAAASTIIDLKADGVFVSNDVCAASLMNEVQRRGFKVPGDILFAGFNNDMISRNVFPPLTTVDYPGFEMGELAAKSMLSHLNNQSDINLTENIIIKSSLVVRQSSMRG
ncbi:LacI family transcriptional regulator [Mucilaginibacter yixingensis]|uniref:LacI family transcriptional regulator n=1 Tax=Mucilaginibacter yixingensis TaxID=1295612 RepID=A0A2T5JBG5_9SPHI|nr:LacI family DNA-binding transcriptional regulator [Mucilaginibacter yixingensis]PTQ98204.1 LacI family transcriptional regulator [Mucilaginibacter yixingensis]